MRVRLLDGTTGTVRDAEPTLDAMGEPLWTVHLDSGSSVLVSDDDLTVF